MTAPDNMKGSCMYYIGQLAATMATILNSGNLDVAQTDARDALADVVASELELPIDIVLEWQLVIDRFDAQRTLVGNGE